jgi:hypothetical protein
MAAPMKSPAAIFLLVIAGLSVLVGLPRAGVEFGDRGLVAYAELVLWPAGLFAAAIFLAFPTAMPSRRGWVVSGWTVAILTTLLMVVATLFGVGSLVR